MEYRVLGPLEVLNGQRSLPLAGAKQRSLLALLLLHANHVLSRDRLIDELWGNKPPETAVQSLQVYVSRLRKLLPAETLLTRPPGYLLEVEPAELDLHCFERLLGEGRDALAEGDPARAATALHNGLGLWRGPALADLAFEPFAQAEIGRLDALRLAAVEERIEADLALGRHADLIGELEALVAENPHRERLRGQLMLALYRSGRQAEALEGYRNARRVLVEELGLEPGAALQRLEKSILVQDDHLDTPEYGRPSRERVATGGTQARHRPLRRPGDGERARRRSRAHRGVSRRGPPRGAGRDRSGRRHGRERNRRRADRDLRGAARARGRSRAPRSQRRARHPQTAERRVRRHALAADERRERRGDSRPARLVRDRNACRRGGAADPLLGAAAKSWSANAPPPRPAARSSWSSATPATSSWGWSRRHGRRRRAPAGRGDVDSCSSPLGSCGVWMTDLGDDRVTRIDPARARCEIRVGNSPRRIAFAGGKICDRPGQGRCLSGSTADRA